MQKKSIFIIVLAAIVACENSENEPKSQQIKSSIKGIDFSNQKPESPDWENVKEHYRFVI
jgi:hypothetical protein